MGVYHRVEIRGRAVLVQRMCLGRRAMSSGDVALGLGELS